MLRPIITAKFVVAIASLSALAAVAACGAPEPKMMATKDDGVPANSASEERLAMEGKPKPAPAPVAEDPTQPLLTPMGGDATGAAGTGTGTGTAAPGKGGKGPKDGAKGPKDPKGGNGATGATGATGGTGKVSRAECKQTFDKYIDLTLASDPRFEGIPQDMVAQLKETALSQAAAQKGDPCTTEGITRTQYQCAMSSASTTAWQRCMK